MLLIIVVINGPNHRKSEFSRRPAVDRVSIDPFIFFSVSFSRQRPRERVVIFLSLRVFFSRDDYIKSHRRQTHARRKVTGRPATFDSYPKDTFTRNAYIFVRFRLRFPRACTQFSSRIFRCKCLREFRLKQNKKLPSLYSVLKGKKNATFQSKR